MIPSLDGTGFRQYERRVRLFVSNTRVAPDRRAGKLLERLEGRAFESCEGIQALDTPNCVDLLDHLRTRFELGIILSRLRIVDDFDLVTTSSVSKVKISEIYDARFNILLRRFEAVAGPVNPSIKAHVFLRKVNVSAEKQSQVVSAAISLYEYEPLRDAMLAAVARVGALRGGVPSSRTQPGAYSAQVVASPGEDDEEERFLEANEASDDELEAEHREAVARRAEVDQARHFFRRPQSSEDRKARLDKLKQRLPCVRCGQLGHWTNDNECLAKVKVVNWEETEEQMTEEPHPFPVTAFLTHRRERCSATSGGIDTACARTLAGTRWFENFEVELKRHATPVEVVPDSETFRFRPGAVKKGSREVIFPVAVGQNVFWSVIDVEQKTIEFRDFQNAKVPLEVVAGHFTIDLKPKHASSLQRHLPTQLWEQARHGHEVTLRPSSARNEGLKSSSIAHHVSMTATPSKDPSHHKTFTAHVQTAASGLNCHVQSPLPHLAHGVYGRSHAGELLPV